MINNAGSDLEATAAITDVACHGESNGAVTITATGGVGTLTYELLNTGETNGTGTFTDLSAGSYTVLITDENNCSFAVDVDIDEPTELVLEEIGVQAPVCEGSATGIAVVTANGGTPGYSYQWPATAGSQTGPTATGLEAGTYEVTVTDANDCIATLEVVVPVGPELMIASINDVGPVCPGSQVGSIDLSSSPSDVNVVYTWTGGTAAGLADGTSTGVNPQIPAFTASITEGTTAVTVTATLAGDCVSQTTFTIDISDNEDPVFVNCPINGYTVSVDASCSGNVIWSIPVAEDNCGGVTVTETSAGGPYNGTPLVVGTYDIEYTATDGSGNTSTCTFTVEVIDNEDPLLVCPDDLTISADAGVCTWASGAGELDPVLAVDNCPDFALSYEITGATMSSGMGTVSAATQFELGESTITYTLTDDSGNEVTCSFTVTVVDEEAPEIVSQ